MAAGIKDDIRQSVVVAKNEMRKFISGKKIIIFSVITLIILGLLTVIPMIEGGYDSAEDLASTFLRFTGTIVMLASVFFTASSLVSEYEDRTALLIFTRPIKKVSIYFGKLMTSLFVVFAYVAIFYVVLLVYSMVTTGSIADHLGESFCLSICAIFGVSGIAIVMSAFAKKSSTASILTLILTMMMLPMAAHVFADHLLDINMSWVLTEAMNGIPMCIMSGYVVEDLLRDTLVMIAWGVIGTLIGFLIFRKRDF